MKKTIKSLLLGLSVFASLLIFGCSTTTKNHEPSRLAVRYSYLKILDLDQMTNLMQKSVKEFNQTEDSQRLKEALLICFARPDEDGVIEKILAIVRTPLDDRNLWESAFEELQDQSLEGVKNDNLSTVDQVTYSVVIENVLSELRPFFIKQYASAGFETRLVEKIAQADIQLSSEAKNERKLNLMKGYVSPSIVAQAMLERKSEVLSKEKK